MKVLMVTGGSSGIGKAIAERFVASDWHVHNVSRRPCPLDGVVSHTMDLLELSATDEWVKAHAETWAEASQICLVHNAAMQPHDSIRELDSAELERCLRLNVTAPAALTKAMLPFMKSGSSVIYVGSTLSEKAVPGCLSYVTAKHAVVGLMRSTCQDLHGSGIHAACICPGFTDTEMLRPALESNPEFHRAILDMVSFGRLVAPKEIADLTYFVSQQPVMNGAVLHANLGQRES